MKKIILCFWVIGLSINVHAQQDEKITYESIKQQCSGIPLAKKARVSVTRFSVTTNTNDPAVRQNARANNRLKALSLFSGNGGNAPRADEIPPTLGDNMSTMLTNALQGVNCFRVLETLKNNDDLTAEINAGTSSLSSKKAPKAGKQLGAQIVATGEIIEYSVKDKGVNVMGVGTSKKLVKIGFDLKMINPETRDVIVSHVFRVQSKSNSSVSVLGLVSTSNSDPAVAAVMEDGVIKAVEFMAHVRDSLNITSDNIPGSSSNPGGGTEIEITLNNANFSSFNALAGIIAGMPGYKAMEKSLSSGVGSYTVTYANSADEFLDALNKRVGVKYEVTGFDAGKVELKAK
ncbi:CsgG/HfaB family protein [Mucilaginibacter sp. SP1R1]|uniref:CsgG/HfaB family protein n=1 Tax=Mucilaginibacter sp. SP1R1 TaxID=2723091 RepID=UPI0016213E8D|nr:CsgG/HfaB family protein [Mucilaginibacter sp. SP1R1]MBB6151020.1 curli biogenesis system outer membrane secretion channel CsgG [Mucilaginibacter sp. SP1R1]